ncbi:23S rRNA (guanosine(2251)-2'-O)-methyltransferase RlmB [Paenibacillus psychroresistens]|uniref:23S rRNA (Guanosine(2251)-2'-O)-methyltransferase RlmB n=1 Tax=Paenibacillus psychroresistens TaxID=1778678 RepID=A0A6B8RAE4_9BACL|nr:23S rRNA (guanosine(2251)-2'-O)-methyltransferase RlmB [Paenibacillus psychroresistens]QGQ93599.1 23S rRNA (guanosine(2251)-2'-O)-methyltransferase RlmB [Paenibacillus psychroresistens]
MEDQKSSEEYIGGKHPILEAMRAGRTINKIWIADNAQKHYSGPIIAEAKELGILVQTADRRKIDQMLEGVQTQGVVAQVAAYDYVEVEDILRIAKEKGQEPLILILDEIEDPHNLGSILRSADCTGVHGVIIPKRRSVGLTATVAKTSAGAIEYVPVAKVTNIAQTIEALKKKGVWIAGADGDAKSTVYQNDLTIPLAIVIGNEGNGIGRLIKEKCDFLIKLPMFGQINSLNASVAASVILYEAVRQRHIKK